MATHKVPQDVEAEDKLVGPLSLKQFIFTIIMIGSLYMCYLFARVNIVLAILPLPLAIVTGVLGLYQRKDQPVEAFMASFLRFHLKPRKRVWDQEGFEQRVVITVPKAIEKHYTNNLSSEQVNSRLGQLSALMDSRGWASKHTHPLTNAFAGSQQVGGLATVTDTGSSDRLLSAQEIQYFSAPPLPLDSESTATPDLYEDVPSNPVGQSVDRGIKVATKNQRERTQAIVEDARRKPNTTVGKRTQAPHLTTRPDHRVQKVIATDMPVSRPAPANSQKSVLPPRKDARPSTTSKPKPKTSDTSVEETDNEVTISIHHSR